MRFSIAAAPESLTEQQRQPLASSKNSVASAEGSSGDETEIARPVKVVEANDAKKSCNENSLTLNVRSIPKFIHDNSD